MTRRIGRPIGALLLCALLPAFGALTRLSEIGRPPAMTPSGDPTRDPSWRPMTMPMPAPEPMPNEPNALWRSGSRAFFKDQRAAQVGDIVTVMVNVNDNAKMKNVSSATRSSAETGGLPGFFGMEKLLPPTVADPSKILSVNSGNNNVGNGQIQRTEAVALRLAGVVTQVLPNGNLVIAGRQEVRVNNDLRELKATGVIRPEDIRSDNTISSDKIAEARISYGGRGIITDVQQPRYGQQIFDVIFPF